MGGRPAVSPLRWDAGASRWPWIKLRTDPPQLGLMIRDHWVHHWWSNLNLGIHVSTMRMTFLSMKNKSCHHLHLISTHYEPLPHNETSQGLWSLPFWLTESLKVKLNPCMSTRDQFNVVRALQIPFPALTLLVSMILVYLSSQVLLLVSYCAIKAIISKVHILENL